MSIILIVVYSVLITFLSYLLSLSIRQTPNLIEAMTLYCVLVIMYILVSKK